VEEGWPGDAVPVLRGVALAAENATAYLGELRTTRASSAALMVQLTRDEVARDPPRPGLAVERPRRDGFTLERWRSDARGRGGYLIRSSMRTCTVSPASLPIALRSFAFTGSL